MLNLETGIAFGNIIRNHNNELDRLEMDNSQLVDKNSRTLQRNVELSREVESLKKKLQETENTTNEINDIINDFTKQAFTFLNEDMSDGEKLEKITNFIYSLNYRISVANGEDE